MKRVFKITVAFLIVFLSIFMISGCKEEPTEVGINVIISEEALAKEYKVGENVPEYHVFLVFSDDSTKEVNDYSSDLLVFSEENKTLTITYHNYSKSIEFKVAKEIKIDSIIVKDATNLSFADDDLSFYNLKVYAHYTNDEEELVTNYKLKLGELKDEENNIYEIKVTYMGFATSFTAKKVSNDNLLEVVIPKKGLVKVSTTQVKNKIESVQNGGSRLANYIVYYTPENFSQTNVYGYEFAIDENGIVISADTNVVLPENGAILSAHGTGKGIIKGNVSLGDYVYYDSVCGVLYVFDTSEDFNIILSRFIDYAYSLATTVINNINALEGKYYVEILKDTNKVIMLANELISYCNENDVEQFSNSEEQVKKNNLVKYYNETYLPHYLQVKEAESKDLSYEAELDFIKFAAPTIKKETAISHVSTITINHEGGFRNTNEMVYYDKSCLVTRNTFGSEISVNAEGMVVEKGTNVSLPKDGFIISGHGDSKDLIDITINVNDYVTYNNLTLEVYRDPYNGKLYDWYLQIKEIIDYVYEASENAIPLHYGSIEKKLNCLIGIYNEVHELVTNNAPFTNMLAINRFSQISLETQLLEVEYLLLDQNVVQTKAFWYDMASMKGLGYPDNSVESVDSLLELVSSCGFNTIYLACDTHGYVNFKSDYLQPMNDYCTKPGQYGNYKDYLECIVEEGKKYGVAIRVWLKTTICGSTYDVPSNIPSDWICTNLSGDYPTEEMLHYDSINPEAREYMKNVYLEVVNNYDVDGIEFDYIRYGSSNIANLKGTVTASQVNDYSFTAYGKAAFMKKYGYTGDFDTLFLSSEDVRTKWTEFKYEAITATVKLISDAAREARSDCYITAAVFGPDSRFNVCQEWDKWLEDGLLDCVEPMLYTNDVAVLEKKTDKTYKLVDGNGYPVIGIGPTINNGSHADILCQIRSLEKYSYSYSVFCGKTMFDSNAFNETSKLYNITAIPLNASEEVKAKAVANQLLEEINSFYKLQYSDNYTKLINSLNDLISDYSSEKLDIVITNINALSDQNVKNNMLNKLSVVKVG